MATTLEVAQLCKRFGSHKVLNGIDLEVEAGEVVAIVGPSGGGKSTLLRCINFLEKPDEGTVVVDGELMGYEHRKNRLHELSARRLRAQRAKIGMVFQHFNLFSNLSVLQNVMEGPRFVKCTAREDVEKRARAFLRRVGMEEKCSSYPSQISGGQQQRVAIARALAMDPTLMLFDEPTSALDPELVGEVLQVIRELANAGMTMLIVTHEVSFARDVADRGVFIDGGLVIEEGPAREMFAAPRHERTSSFLASALSDTSK